METTMNHTQARPHVVTVMKNFHDTDNMISTKNEATPKPAPPVIEYDWSSPQSTRRLPDTRPSQERVTKLSSKISTIIEAEYTATLKAHDSDATIMGIQSIASKNLGQTSMKGIVDGASSGSWKKSKHSGDGKAENGKDGSEVKNDWSRGEALKNKVTKARATMEARRDGWVMVEDSISMEWDCVDDAFSDPY